MKRFGCVKSCSGETRGWNALDLFGMCEITSNLTGYDWATGVCEYSQTKQKESKKCPRGQKKKHCISRTIYPPPGAVFRVSIVASLGSLGLRKGGQINGPPNLAIGGATNHLKFDQGVLQYQKCANILYDAHFPYPSSPFKITKLYVCEYSQTKSKGVKRGGLWRVSFSENQHPPYACAFQGRDKTQGGPSPPRGS